MGKIITLSKELINHIAAGEVVERPASVLKELLENAIDAGSDKISVKVGQGGIEHIEVSDNGSGIEPDDLENAVQPHSTSKINSVDDLSHIETLGFRGEALASVAAISKLSILTKTEASSTAQMMVVTGGEIAPVKMASRDTGTTIRVEDLFHAVPARKKFLKQPKTEYRKIIDVFVPLALMHPEIHWTLESDGRIVHTLPSIAGTLGGSLHPQRVFELLPGIEFVEVFYDGEGIVVGGMVGHPSHKAPRVSERYVFVNGRPVWDNGIAKAVMMGSARFIPEGMRVPFLISLNISHDQVDVNVHPRKMEVRFANPYRVYSAVESAVRKAYEDNVRESLSSEEPHRLRRGGAGEDISNEGGREHTLSDSFENRSTTQSFRESTHAISRPVNPHTVEESLSFSKLILSDASQEGGTGVLPQESSKSPEIDPDTVVSARQYLNRYVIAQLNDAILIIDQHAAAERIRFEKLLRDYEDRGIESQTLMLPLEIRMSSKELLFV
ncbi:MAG: DNA mismatch repair endonuclease MutL, partial [Candidatus Dojkabacteria bacterium]|nr:DNA mismatch repair endonuclease MutL [Candidatus Dojkabacteria bacterium]